MKRFILFIAISTLIGCGSMQNLQDKLISEHPEWTNEQIELIRNKKIAIDMTEDMVRAAWGEPYYINKTDSEYTGRVTAWTYYKLFGSNIKTVTFKEGLVSAFSDAHPNQNDKRD